MKVSFLIPTRERLPSLLEGIQSIKKTASPDVDVEFLVRIDDDDHDTLAGRDFIPGEVIIGPRWCGYDCVHIFYNELAAKSRGDWIILWNDDTFMKTYYWDKLLPLADSAKVIWLYSPTSWSWAFPAMTRKLYELWGCFVPSGPADLSIMIHSANNTDSRIFDIWLASGKPIPNPEEHLTQIVVDHKRDEANIRAIDIKPENKVSPPQNYANKKFDDLVKLLRDAP